MISYHHMSLDMAVKLGEIDRSETIDKVYEIDGGKLSETDVHYECSNWDEMELNQIKERFSFELRNGGIAIGAFAGELLAGFGVLGHKFMGPGLDQLQVDLMYVSRNFRKQGIGTTILQMISAEAKIKGANYLYISSTETGSAVSFYMRNGGKIAGIVDDDLFRKEPGDIHIIKLLD